MSFESILCLELANLNSEAFRVISTWDALLFREHHLGANFEIK